MFSIALSLSVFHALALLGLLAAFALDNARQPKLQASAHAASQAVFEPTDEQILMMGTGPVAARSQSEPEPRSSVAHAA